MISQFKLLIALFAFAIITFTSTSHALTLIQIEGTFYVDSDSDGIIDNTGFADIPSPPEGTVLDNCPDTPNGNCHSYPYACNIDNSVDENNQPTLSDIEWSVGYQADSDNNGIGDACDDEDDDGFLHYLDNCPIHANPDQDGSICQDPDNDDIITLNDNCPNHYNPSQNDYDNDTIGDSCDQENNSSHSCTTTYTPGELAQVDDSCPIEIPPTDITSPEPDSDNENPVENEITANRITPNTRPAVSSCSITYRSSISMIPLLLVALLGLLKRIHA